MNVADLFPSKYLAVGDLKGFAHTLVVSHVEPGQFTDREKNEIIKPVVYFEGKTKGFVANKTNTGVLMKEWGEETDDWTGKELELYPDYYKSNSGNMEPHIKMRIGADAAPVGEEAPKF